MGIEAITTNNGDDRVVPSTPGEWRHWVSASATRNFMIGDFLGDWLNLYGGQNGFTKDDATANYDGRLSFLEFVFEKGYSFEAALLQYLSGTLGYEIATLSEGPSGVQDLDAAIATFNALAEGRPIVHQGVLRDPQSMTYGAADFLVRSDVVAEMFPTAISALDATTPAPGLGASPWHYVVLDAKFTTLPLLANGEIANSRSKLAYKAQLFIYNRALGRLQGYTPDKAFLVGRSWEQGFGARKQRGNSALERLGPISVSQQIDGQTLENKVDQAAAWVRRVRTEGRDWRPLPTPSVPELWPDGSYDAPWKSAKTRIASELADLTQLWQVSAEVRNAAHRNGFTSWRDPRCTAVALGITGGVKSRTLQAILDVNQSTEGPAVLPASIVAGVGDWRETPNLEFYVDFETVSDLDDDFTSIPQRGGQPMIFMIGCGHQENGKWTFSSFTANALVPEEEVRIINAWYGHMTGVSARLGKAVDAPRIIHWSAAEESFLERAFNSAKKRHPEEKWPPLNWFDFLSRVIRQEPVVTRGALGFGLKAVAKAMNQHGLIETTWDDSLLDGMGAMVGAWRASEEAGRAGLPMGETELIQEIGRYNEVDCKVMMEIVSYLRAHH